MRSTLAVSLSGVKSRLAVFSVLLLLILWAVIVYSPPAAARDYWCTVDDHTRLLPGNPPDGWPYNQVGGNRGLLSVYPEDPKGVAQYVRSSASSYEGKVVRLLPDEMWGYLGFSYALGHDSKQKASFNPKAIFPSMILPAYQGKLTGVDLLVTNIESPAGRSDLNLVVELKGFDAQVEVPRWSRGWQGTELMGGGFPKTLEADLYPDTLGEVGLLVLKLDHAVVNDAMEIDRIRLKVQMPELSTAAEAFVVSLAMLLDNFDAQTGMVQDRSNFPKGEDENVSATGKLAKLLAMAIKMGYVDEVQAKTAITTIANTLLTMVPRGPGGINGLWPHFTCKGGTERIWDSEWASGDTAYALLDLIVGLKMIGDPLSQLPAAIEMLKTINWASLRAPNGGYYYGYAPDGALLEGTWHGFGAETLGVLLAAMVGGDKLGNMESPPSDNGSGFIYHAGYPLIPEENDRWGNNWKILRGLEADTQIGWYANPQHANPILVQWKLFGLSAAEKPEGWDPDKNKIYQAYGMGGKFVPYNDGDHKVVALHYSGMIAPLRPNAAVDMWESLKTLGIISPLNNMESMAVNSETGMIEMVNYLKGSWNLCLQAEGWALANNNNNVAMAVRQAFFAVPELAWSYRQIFPRAMPERDLLLLLSN